MSLSLSRSFGRTEIESAWVSSQDSKAVQMWYILSDIPAGMSKIIINNRNPTPKFNFCSVFSAKNPTVNELCER